MFNVESVALKKLKSLSFVGKVNILRSGGVKSNDENMVKSNEGIPSPHGSEIEGTCFFG